MTERVKHVSELPEWFQLNKYDAARKLDAAAWYEQLFVRYNTKSALERLHEDDDEYAIGLYETDLDMVDNTIAKIELNPIIDISSDIQLTEDFLSKTLSELKQKMPHYTLGVHNITVAEFFDIECAAGTPLKKMKQQLEKYFNDTEGDIKPPGEWQDKPINKLHRGDPDILHEAIRINWALSDTTLMEHFKQFIKLHRPAEININDDDDLIKKFHRKPNFSEWCRLGVLPYLDLKLWAYEVEVTIPNRVMANALYPSGMYGEETVRKTTAPLADMLMTETALEALAHHAAFEIAERTGS